MYIHKLFPILAVLAISVKVAHSFFTLPINLLDFYGVINVTSAAENETDPSLHWHFAKTLASGQMIRINFSNRTNATKFRPSYDKSSYFKPDFSCYYFAHKQQANSECRVTAKHQNCKYVLFETVNLNIHLDFDGTPQQSFNYEYYHCSGKPLRPRDIPRVATLAPQPAATRLSTTTTTTAPFKTNQTTDTLAPAHTTSGTNGTTEKVDDRAAPSPTETTRNPGETTRLSPTPFTPNGQSQGISTTTVIIIAVAVILLVLAVVMFMTCAKRFRRYHKQIKEIHSGKLSASGNSGAPHIDPLYEEIAPRLPSRNNNMAEPGYEVPLCAIGASQDDKSKPGSSLTVDNELYLKPIANESQPSSENHTSKYGLVNNELYSESSGADEDVNDETKDSVAVSLSNELYISTDTAQEQPQPNTVHFKPDNVTGNTQKTSHTSTSNTHNATGGGRDENNVTNVLYNM